MPDKEKVIKGLECCQYSSKSHCDGCPYVYDGLCSTNDCTAELASDSFALLKEQEPRVMTRLEIEQSEECIVWFEDDQFDSYAFVDGIDQRNGWVWLSTVGDMGLQQRRDCENYGKRWRCWTKRPTEDQRKAVKCE